MKIPPPPKISKDPVERKKYQPQLRLLVKSQIIGLSSIFSAIMIVSLCISDYLEIYLLLFVPLLVSLVYYEIKQYNLHNDALIIKRYLYDKRFAEWYKKYHLKNHLEE